MIRNNNENASLGYSGIALLLSLILHNIWFYTAFAIEIVFK